MRAHGMRNSSQALHGDQCILEENFAATTTPPARDKIFDRNADVRSVCGS